MFAASTLVVAGAQSAGAAPASKAPHLKGQTITMVLQGGYAPDEMIFRRTSQLLQQWGANVKVITAGSTQIEMGALTTGQAQVVEASPQAGLAALDAGLSIQAFAVTGPKDDDIFASAASIKKPSQLKGQKVSVFSMDGLNGVETQMVANAGHIPVTAMNIVSGSGQTVRLVQLENGSASASPITVAFYDEFLKPKGLNLLYNYMTQQPKLVAHVLWAKPQWLKSHAKMALAVDEAVLASYRWFDARGAEKAYTSELLKLVTGTTVGYAHTIFNAFRQYHFYPPNYVITDKTMGYNQTLLHTAKQLTKVVPTSKWVVTKYDAEALKALGRK